MNNCEGCKFAGHTKTKYGVYQTCGKYSGSLGERVKKCNENKKNEVTK